VHCDGTVRNTSANSAGSVTQGNNSNNANVVRDMHPDA
jgi:hypothetical protein